MEGIHMLWPLSVNPKQSNQQPTAVTAWNVVCLFPILVLFILLFPIRAGTDCNILSVPNHNIWRVPVCQRHCQEVCCTGERGNLRSNGSHAWPAARKSCQTSMCTTTTFLVIRTHIYTPPPSTLTFKMFLSSSTACNPFLKAWGPRRKISNRKTWLFVAIYNKLRWQDEWGTKEQWIWRQEKVHCYIQDNLSRKGLC